ncbi:MAG: tRNA (adenosine(37)-N6)-threonylcarbamoyltransferase complex dimerization subunit type 1 TsaB, partial [Salibacteraceae bacterium]|nr:tRNA (adenosine(37)-N6)-threonylcarbamoyltransferase complex dimerization subunit type 1 TsaB [Salibacteraceae bacterium]
VIFFGNGSDKFKEISTNPSAYFVADVFPSATQMIGLSEMKFQQNQFEDVAYFEPFYLKEFQATTPRKLI